MFTPVEQDWLTVTVKDMLNVLQNDQAVYNTIMRDAEKLARQPWGLQAFRDSLKEYVGGLIDNTLHVTDLATFTPAERAGYQLIVELVSNFPQSVWEALAQHFWNLVEIEES